MAQGFASDIPPAVNGTAKKYIRGMMKGKNRWNKLYGNRSKEVMHKTANKMAMGEMSKMPPTYTDVFGEAKMKKEETINERADMWHPDPEKDKKLGGPGANARAREDGAAASKPKEDPKKLKPGESYMDYSKRQKAAKSGTATSRLNKMGANIKPKKKSLLGRLGLRKEDVVNEKAGEKGAANYGKKSEGIKFKDFQEKALSCWKGYKKVGSKMKGGKVVNNCVKEEEVTNEGASWTKKSGKNSEGGLNEKGRKSYEKENPGSDLKAPSKKVGNPRRASFCDRMKGMRKRQKPSNNTGEDRLSKSLRAWNC